MTLPHRSGREAQLGACGAGVGQLESVKKPPDTNTKECADDHVHELRPGEFGRLYAEEQGRQVEKCPDSTATDCGDCERSLSHGAGRG